MVMLPVCVVNVYVLRTVVSVFLGVFVAAMFVGSSSAIIEMEGFQQTFDQLYGGDGGSGEGSSSVGTNLSGSSGAGNRTCGSGNGASSDILIGVYVSLLNISSVFGYLMTGWIADQFSRKYSLVFGGLLLSFGCAILASSFPLWTLFLGRAIGGLALGVLYMMTTLYVAEVSPKESRGMTSSISGPGYNFGFITALLLNVGFAKFFVGWRVSLGIVSFLSLLYAIAMMFMPHTPRWLVMKHRDKTALLVLTKINGHSKKETFVDTYFELEDIRESISTSSKNNCFFMVKELYRLKYRLFVTLTLFMISSSTGLFVYYYPTTIFCLVGVPPFLAALVLGIIILMGGFVPVFLADKVGRKPILVFSSVISFVVLLAAAILLHLFQSRSVPVTYIVVVLICVFAFTYSGSWLTVPWTIAAEVFPTNVRGLAVAISTMAYGVFGFVSNQLTPIITGSSLQLHGFLYIVAGESLAAALFVFFALPETKGVSLEDMDTLFSQSCLEHMKLPVRCKELTSNKKESDKKAQVNLQDVSDIDSKPD